MNLLITFILIKILIFIMKIIIIVIMIKEKKENYHLKKLRNKIMKIEKI